MWNAAKDHDRIVFRWVQDWIPWLYSGIGWRLFSILAFHPAGYATLADLSHILWSEEHLVQKYVQTMMDREWIRWDGLGKYTLAGDPLYRETILWMLKMFVETSEIGQIDIRRMRTLQQRKALAPDFDVDKCSWWQASGENQRKMANEWLRLHRAVGLIDGSLGISDHEAYLAGDPTVVAAVSKRLQQLKEILGEELYIDGDIGSEEDEGLY